jgi:hypothetical protein
MPWRSRTLLIWIFGRRRQSREVLHDVNSQDPIKITRPPIQDALLAIAEENELGPLGCYTARAGYYDQQ